MRHDYIVIGSGAGGAAAAWRLAQTGRRILVLEKGDELPTDGSTLDVDRVIRQKAFTSRERWRTPGGRTVALKEYFNLGGKTKWTGAALIRFQRHEFDADPDHRCRAWPIGYDDLEPYYAKAEDLLAVRSFAIEADLQRILAGLRRHDPAWEQHPLPLGLAPRDRRSPRGDASIRWRVRVAPRPEVGRRGLPPRPAQGCESRGDRFRQGGSGAGAGTW